MHVSVKFLKENVAPPTFYLFPYLALEKMSKEHRRRFYPPPPPFLSP